MKALRLLVLAPLALGCGSRTGLLAPTGDAAPADGGTSLQDSGADVGPLPCTATGPPGSMAWQLALVPGPMADAGAMTFNGPWAADPTGATYYLGTAGAYPSTYSLIAVDACGHAMWRTDGTPYGQSSQVRPTLLVDGDAVVVQIGAVDAFDRRTGDHLWSVSLDALAGEKLASDDQAEIGPSAAAADGTVYVSFETATTMTIAAITAAGAPSVVARTPAQGDLISFILDAAGHLDVLFNSALQGSYVESFTRSGSAVFAAAFSCQVTFLGPMASAASFLLMQTGPCVLSLQGTTAFTFSPAPEPGDFAAMVVGAQDSLYVNESTPMASSYDASGRRRWTTPLPHYGLGGPLLSQSGEVIFLEADLSSRPITSVTVAALDSASGSTLWSRDVGTMGDLAALGTAPVLLTSARQTVFGIGGNVVVALVAGGPPDPAAAWPTPSGGVDSRNAARGQ
jgi:outer membrane protein assembly factor BamB